MRMPRFVAGAACIVALGVLVLAGSGGGMAKADTYGSYKPDCADPFPLCTEVANPQEAFGNYYIGHDEPAVEFYSNTPGSGNHAQYKLTIPTEPTGAFSTAKGYERKC